MTLDHFRNKINVTSSEALQRRSGNHLSQVCWNRNIYNMQSRGTWGQGLGTTDLDVMIRYKKRNSFLSLESSNLIRVSSNIQHYSIFLKVLHKDAKNLQFGMLCSTNYQCSSPFFSFPKRLWKMIRKWKDTWKVATSSETGFGKVRAPEMLCWIPHIDFRFVHFICLNIN